MYKSNCDIYRSWVTLQKDACYLSLTDARVAVVVVSGNSHNI